MRLSSSLILFALALLMVKGQDSTCMSRCTQSHAYYKRQCSGGLFLGDDCSKGDGFCGTPYSRCSDGICACLPNFQPKNLTQGKPPMCVPEASGLPNEVTMDICRYDKTGDPAEIAPIVMREAEVTNPLWSRLTRSEAEPVCPIGCIADEAPKALYVAKAGKSPERAETLKESAAAKKQRRRKRETSSVAGAPWLLPPTVVSECRIGQVCFQIGPSAYGICRMPQCPVGKPAQHDCTYGDDTTCPVGFYCHSSGGKIFDAVSGKSKQATMCCPSICDNGFYRNGRCFQDTNCLDSIDDCEDRCEFEPCRFMVNPCENYGTCFVPKGPAPSYFWCQCVPGKTGRVCEQDGISINRPTKERRIPCEDSLCMPSRFSPALQAAAQVSAHNFFTAASATAPPPRLVAPLRPQLPTPPKPALACRENKLANCETLAFRGDCDSNRAHMVANCDCACTKLILYGRQALKPNLG